MSTQLFAAAVDIGSDKGFLNQLLTLLVIGICVGIVYLMGLYFIKRPSVPPVALTIWNGLFVLVGGVAIINFLMGLGGNAFISW